jgi:hypothetical protein
MREMIFKNSQGTVVFRAKASNSLGHLGKYETQLDVKYLGLDFKSTVGKIIRFVNNHISLQDAIGCANPCFLSDLVWFGSKKFNGNKKDYYKYVKKQNEGERL